MASNINSSISNRQATKVQQYVDNQLEKTRRQVKTNDLFVACLTWAAAVAAFFLVMALIDAWVVSLSTTFRWIALAFLILGSLSWLVLSTVPLFLRKINLDYAAQMIEQAVPNVKNSVLSYSLLKNQDEPVNVAVMDAVSRQAAQKLHSIPDDATIDRSHLIRIGFILVGLMFFGVTYKLLSPRDPLQTVRRILFPAEQISKPASVLITQVNPGNCHVFFGDSLQVTAAIKGPHRPEEVILIVSSDDGQIIDRPFPMEPDETGGEYKGLISLGDKGIQQSLRYRIEARDGVTPEYRIAVKANPAIAIDSIQLTPPNYTRLPVQTLTGRGDIEAIEGTEAMIFAVANLPIEVAYIELLNEVSDPNADPEDLNAKVMRPAAPPIEMRLLSDNLASGRFNVALNSRRTKPLATHYQIRFVSKNDDRNETPNVYPIRVTPDLAPEVRIVHPHSQQTNLAVNGTLPIHVEANDLDFAIASVVLNIDHQGSHLVRRSMELESNNDNQRVSCQFLFQPNRHRLQPGDRVIFHAVASDNRISVKSLEPDPNVSQTGNFTVTITETDPDVDQQRPPENEPRRSDKNEQQPDKNRDAESRLEDPGTSDNRESTNDSASGDEPKSPDGDSQDQNGTANSKEQNSEQHGADNNGKQESSKAENSEADGGSGERSQKRPQESRENGGGSAEQDPDQSGASGRNERRNDGVSNQGDSQSSSSSGGNQSGGSEGASASSDSESSDGNSGGSPDGSNQQGSAGADQDDPDARASDSATNGGAQGSQSNGGARSDPGDRGPDGTRDQSLKDGKREQLSKDAHDGERFERLEELLKDQEPSNQPSDSSNGQQYGSNENRDSQSNSREQPNGNSHHQPSGNGTNEQNLSQQGPSSDQPDGKSDPKHSENTSQSPNEPRQSGGSPTSPTTSGKNGNQNDSQASQGSQSSHGSGDSESPKGSESSQGPSSQSSANGEGEGSTDNSSSNQDQSSGQSVQSGAHQNPSNAQQNPNAKSGSNNSGQQGTSQSQSSNAMGQVSGVGESGAASSEVQSFGAGADQANNNQLEKEQADLEHAKKATDLVLSKLEDQKYDPDPDLLDKMNWTEQNLRDFVDRWNQMKQNAQTGDLAAKREYEEAIKSLGLRPDGRTRTSQTRDANASGLNQDSSVIEAPAELAPDFNEFLRDRNRVR